MNLLGVFQKQLVNLSSPDDDDLFVFSKIEDFLKGHGFNIILNPLPRHHHVASLR